ncbi:MAG: hypothetical protein Q9206_000629 [Seirophora lacunosa]
MYRNLPAIVHARSVPGKGTGLFTSKSVPAGELVFAIERPLVRIPDNEHLAKACYNCFYLEPPEGRSELETRTLKICNGCKVVKYCSKRCQSRSWKVEHKYECKALGQLYPKIAPSAVRMAMQILLRRQSGSIPDTGWQELLALEAHVDDFKDGTIDARNSTKWQDIELMSQAATAFSGVLLSPNVVQAIIARIVINSMTVSTAAADAIGTCVSTTAARLNHSCNPNCIYLFSEGSLAVRSLQAIPEGFEVTISYVDPRLSTVERQRRLQRKWFFTCDCNYCTNALTCGHPDLPPSLSSRMSAGELYQLDNEGRRLQEEASAVPANALENLSRAMALFTQHKTIYPLWRYPWISIRQDVESAHIGQGDWASALGHALKIYLTIDPVLFSEAWNPHRAVGTYGVLKITLEILHELTKPQRNEELLQELRDYSIDFPTVIRHLSDEVESTYNKGFGPKSPIAADIEQYKKQGIGFGKSDWQTELTKLKRAADELVD